MIFRSDNRTPEQIRPVNIVPDFISTAEGSALIEMGNTRVICTASVEEKVPPFLAGGPHQRGDYGEGFALNVDRTTLLARKEPTRLSHQPEIRGMGLIVQNQRDWIIQGFPAVCTRNHRSACRW